ncbi:MAG: hypothetical protein F6K24_03915 [Okeania sp. SIO2D1]|nr:hypothetical protein [Okeania sp. SIO2D1]
MLKKSSRGRKQPTPNPDRGGEVSRTETGEMGRERGGRIQQLIINY